ncbi:M20 family metallopeptidase [Planococcus sp. 4-30]|uniref:M20 family metallopeptidase n=1 Tax=Planococcus sp. 4-30 TaxID=2874583 RepID=UPI001CBED22B|nr:M20 family metallopeptidase [Planococcus sp. 4-30]
MKEFIEANHQPMLELIESLVNIDSGSYLKSGIDRVGEVLAEEYKMIGFYTEVHEQERFGNNLVIRHPEAKTPKIVMIAHLDTVFPEGTAEKRPFHVADDLAHGPGVIDMKASHATALFAIKALMNSGSEAYKNVVLVLNTDEEIGSVASRNLIERIAADKKYALILEPAQNGQLVSERKGGGKYFLNVFGKSAHAGIEPENGASAIEELARKILKLHALSEPEKGITINVGLIKGGASVNTIAPFAEAGIDLRIQTPEDGERLDRAIKEICSYTETPGTTVELTGHITRPAWVMTEESRRLIDIIAEEGAKLGMSLKHEKSGGGSDANLTAHIGIPSIDGLGPVGGNAHQETEYLVVSSLTERTLLLANVIERLSGG